MISVDAATRIYHFAFPQEWLAAQSKTHYAPTAFETDGFIHLATREQIPGVIERHLRGHGPRVRLELDPLQCGDSLLWEWSNASADVYPHLTAPIALAAVIEAFEFNPDAP
ncbi:MAG: DUF952 domain-containing protein [Pseudomarimonas sp.]